MRKSIDGLCAIVEDQLKMDPESSSLFLFCGRRRDRIKALFHEPDGFVLIYKRLSVEGRYQWPSKESEVRNLVLCVGKRTSVRHHCSASRQNGGRPEFLRRSGEITPGLPYKRECINGITRLRSEPSGLSQLGERTGASLIPSVDLSLARSSILW